MVLSSELGTVRDPDSPSLAARLEFVRSIATYPRLRACVKGNPIDTARLLFRRPPSSEYVDHGLDLPGPWSNSLPVVQAYRRRVRKFVSRPCRVSAIEGTALGACPSNSVGRLWKGMMGTQSK